MQPHPGEPLGRRHISQEQSLRADARARRWQCVEQTARLPCEGRRRGERQVSPQGNQRTWGVMETAPIEGQGWARLSHPMPTSRVTGLAPGRMEIEADHLLAFFPCQALGEGLCHLRAIPSSKMQVPAGGSWLAAWVPRGPQGDPLSVDSGHAPSQGMITPAPRPTWGTRG